MASPQEDGRSIQGIDPESRLVQSATALPDGMAREERVKHLLAEQIALGQLGNKHVSSVRYRLPDAYDWGEQGLHYGDGRQIDDNYPYNDQIVNPAQVFSSHDERAALVGHYELQLTENDRDQILAENEQAALGRQRQEEIWEMEIAARDRKLAKERSQIPAAQDVTDANKPSQDVFVAEGTEEQRAA